MFEQWGKYALQRALRNGAALGVALRISSSAEQLSWALLDDLLPALFPEWV
jgi:hypothetical protein